jgi:tRNA pseudouridine38-40 synthase
VWVVYFQLYLYLCAVKKRYFIYLSYNGTAYHGWQFQPNGTSIQEVLEVALSTLFRQSIKITGAGRTDTGVHAKLMVAHFDVAEEFSVDVNLTSKLNSFLPKDIAIYKIVEVRPDAHARFDAIARRYEYHIVCDKDVFRNAFATRYSESLDFAMMNKAAATLLEYADFTSFSKLHTDAKTNTCRITIAQWEQVNDGWVFSIEADRFLRNMVRAVVGTLLEVGRSKMTVEEFKAVIEAKNRCKAGSSVPAHGLYLVDIQYPDSVFVLK